MKIILFCLSLLLGQFAQAQALTVAPVKTPAYFTPQFFGVHDHQPTVTGNYPTTPFGVWRMWDGAGTWSDVQPTATTWSWAKSDAYIAAIEKTPGTKILLTFGRTPLWAAADKTTTGTAYGLGSASPPTNMTDFRAYVRALATRYKGRIEAYQTGNEANTTAFWIGTVQQIVDLTCAAYQEIKAADPAALVVSPSGTGAWAAQTVFVKNFLDAGGAKCIDIVSYHLYTSGSPPENFVQPILDMRAQLAAGGYSKFPLWNTETGYLMPGTKSGGTTGWNDYEIASAVSDFDASNFMVRAMMLARAIGFERFYWYAWDNLKMGMIDPVSKYSRETASVLTRFNKLMSGAIVGNCTRSAAWVWVCAVKTTVGNGQVVWVDPSAPAQIIPYTLPFSAAVQTFHSDLVANLTKNMTISANSSPMLLIWK